MKKWEKPCLIELDFVHTKSGVTGQKENKNKTGMSYCSQDAWNQNHGGGQVDTDPSYGQ